MLSNSYFPIKNARATHDVGPSPDTTCSQPVLTLNLHRDQADFAVWCTYKYINSGRRDCGMFVHENHHQEELLDLKAGGEITPTLALRCDRSLKVRGCKLIAAVAPPRFYTLACVPV